MTIAELSVEELDLVAGGGEIPNPPAPAGGDISNPSSPHYGYMPNG